MAKRIIQSPGVEINEIDLSLRLPTPAGTTVYTTGFADQGPTDEVIGISSLSEFENIYGKPKSAAERYFYHTVKATLNSQARLLVNRLPYGAGNGQGFGSSVSVLAYPVVPIQQGTLSGASTTFSTTGSAGMTYLVGKPTQFNITTDQHLKLMNGEVFSWSNTPETTFSALSDLGGAGILVINKGQTVIDGKFNGYYVGLADNTNINPADNFDAIRSVYTVTQSAGSTGLTSFVNIPASRFDFALSATPVGGDNYKNDSISQIMEEKITGYDTSTRAFDDTLNFGLFKIRQSIFTDDANKLGTILEEGYNGSIGYGRQTMDPRGGEAVNFFLENVESNSRNAEILVNPNISNQFTGIQLNDDGTPKNKVRVISQQLENFLATTPLLSSEVTTSTTVFSTVTSLGLSGETITETVSSIETTTSIVTSFDTSLSSRAYTIAGCTYEQLAAARSSVNYADALFPLGAYGEAKLNEKSIGNVPEKLQRAIERVRNADIFDIDIIAEGGLGTIWTYVDTSGSDYFDDTKTTVAIEALRTTSELVNTQARDAYNAIFTKYATFAGPIKDGGRGDMIFIADPIRQILVAGKDSKIINNPEKNFSRDIYWALRHQFYYGNTSYATAYANYLKVYDDYSGLYIYAPSSGFAAAKMVSTDSLVGPWGAPAGLNRGLVGDAIDVAFSPNQRQRDDLYTVSLNPITTFPDQGIVIFGQKTLQKKPSAFDRINVRRNFLYLEKATKSVMKYFIFENNTLFTRSQIINTLSPFFERVKAEDGLYDYLIVCDERNNTAEVIDNNELIVDIYLKPVRTAEFIRVNFYATRTDASFTELIG